jgi:hypothetical protein
MMDKTSAESTGKDLANKIVKKIKKQQIKVFQNNIKMDKDLINFKKNFI